MGSFVRLAFAYAGIMCAAMWISVTLLPKTGFYPRASVRYNEAMTIEFVYHGCPSAASCEKRLETLKSTIEPVCPSCRIEATCARGLDEAERTKLTGLPLARPSVRFPGGVMVLVSPLPEVANAACLQTEQQLKSAGGRCFMANQPRPLPYYR
jgi:hypothetical protein